MAEINSIDEVMLSDSYGDEVVEIHQKFCEEPLAGSPATWAIYQEAQVGNDAIRELALLAIQYTLACRDAKEQEILAESKRTEGDFTMTTKEEMMAWADVYESSEKEVVSPEPICLIPVKGVDSFELTPSGIRLRRSGSDYKVVLNDHHSQECCEDVAADWDTLELYLKTGFRATKEGFLSITPVAGEGFLLKLQDDAGMISFFTPCHNVQNGDYSSSLELQIYVGEGGSGRTVSIDISDCTSEDRYKPKPKTSPSIASLSDSLRDSDFPRLLGAELFQSSTAYIPEWVKK